MRSLSKWAIAGTLGAGAVAVAVGVTRWGASPIRDAARVRAVSGPGSGTTAADSRVPKPDVDRARQPARPPLPPPTVRGLTDNDHVSAEESAAIARANELDAARRAVLDVLDVEIIPHAKAEEAALYPAGDTPTAALLVRAMREEHRALIGRVDRLRDATAPAVAAGHAAAVLALLESHLWKENELLVPAILGDPSTSLAELLAGMHELIG